MAGFTIWAVYTDTDYLGTFTVEERQERCLSRESTMSRAGIYVHPEWYFAGDIARQAEVRLGNAGFAPVLVIQVGEFSGTLKHRQNVYRTRVEEQVAQWRESLRVKAAP